MRERDVALGAPSPSGMGSIETSSFRQLAQNLDAVTKRVTLPEFWTT